MAGDGLGVIGEGSIHAGTPQAMGMAEVAG